MALTGSELARKLGVSKGRISQYVSSGKLDGCFEGEGRQRRFDLERCAAALGKRLDQGQMMGNGASTRAALEKIGADRVGPRKELPAGATKLPEGDDGRYQLARTLKAEEEARRLRRQNAEDEGAFVLASEVRLQVQRQIGQEVAEFESVMRDAARTIADEFGVDFKSVKAVLIGAWRAHRKHRAEKIAGADRADLNPAEAAADI